MNFTILPMLPGYALGGLIKREDLELPLLVKSRETVEVELAKAQAERENLEKLHAFNQLDDKTKELKITECNQKIIWRENDLKGLTGRITALYKTRTFFALEETLPIEYTSPAIRALDAAFYSEKTYHTFLNQIDSGEKAPLDVYAKIAEFVSGLFGNDAPASMISSSAIEGVVRSIKNLLDTESKVVVVGSFITLTRVRVLDPVRIRKGAKLSDQLVKDAEKYVVLTEAVLGGAFLGFGKYFGGISEANKSEHDSVAVMSKVATVSFISQGAIPPATQDVEDVNLWNIYVSWKKALKEDPLAGYPIGFKFRSLVDVLSENNRLPSEDD